MILLLHLAVAISCNVVCGYGYAEADELAGDRASQPDPVADPAGEYHTPLAGERRKIRFLGHDVLIPGIDRSRLTALTLGGSILHPRQGTLGGVPIGAMYIRRVNDEYRTRDVISVVENELEYDKRFAPLDLVTYFTNYTIPFDQSEVVNGHEVSATAVSYGNVLASVGPGLRIPVAPFQVDNNFRLQLLGRVGYSYADRSHETGHDVVIPPDTLLYGAKLRARYDGMRRNLLELLHTGFATGFDLDYTYRDNWRNLSPNATGPVNHGFWQGSGYLAGAGGIPGLSERNRVLVYAGGGTTSGHGADRYNAFLVNGGPFPSEEDEFIRPHYSGTIYDDVRATSYATAALSYRRELAFFLYLSLVGSYIWSDRATVEGADQVVFKGRSDAAGTVALDTAFFWDSSLYLAYTWDTGLVRNGKGGSGVTMLWNKMF